MNTSSLAPLNPQLSSSQVAASQTPFIEPEWVTRMKQRVASRAGDRAPNRSTEFNTADIIERQMQQEGHRKWGFVIYRSTYDNEEEWEEFLRRVRFHTEEYLGFYGGRDLLESFELTVLSDQLLFNEASTDTIRRHFQQWCVSTWQSEQEPPGEQGTGTILRMGWSARYRFAVQVDKEALHSVLHDAPAPPKHDLANKGWVKLIDKTWYLGRGGSSSTDNVDFPPIDGLSLEDLGWMKVPYSNLTYHYQHCGMPNFWAMSYRRPPQVLD